MQIDEIMTLSEVALYLKCSRAKARYLAADGELPGVRVGRAWRFRRSDIEAYLDANRVG
jgi:excisionase family DNA binding protein